MIGSCWFAYNAPGCFLWADVESSGRVHVVADYKFQHLPVEAVATEIHTRTLHLEVSRLQAIYAAPSMFPKRQTEHGYRTLEPEAPSESFARFGLPMYPAGSIETHGWQRVHDYLRLAPDGMPWLTFAPECRALLRTLPTLTQAKRDPDEADGELFAAHALRILLSARPSTFALDARRQKPAFGTIAWLRARDRKPDGVLAR